MQSIVASIFLFLVVKVIEDRRPLLFLIALTALLKFVDGPAVVFEARSCRTSSPGFVVLSVFLLAFAWDRLRPRPGAGFVVLAPDRGC